MIKTATTDNDSVSASHWAGKASEVTFLVNSISENAKNKDCVFKITIMLYSHDLSVRRNA